jgi:GTP-binding protein
LKAVVVILDIRREPSPGDINLLDWLSHYNIGCILVLTKADKLTYQQSLLRAKSVCSQLHNLSTADKPTIFSAKTREGRAELWQKINRFSGIGNPQDHKP